MTQLATALSARTRLRSLRPDLGLGSLAGAGALLALLTAAPPALADGANIIATVASSREPWQPYKTKSGVAVERRPVAGSKYYEYRSSVTVAMAPAAVLRELWTHVTDGNATMIKHRQVLKQSDSEILLYDQIKTPVVSDRDYTLVIHKSADEANQRYQMTFETANERGPAVDPKYVRIPAIRGAWSAEPDGAGGSKLTYTSFSEPGGSIPAFLIHGAHFDQIVHDVKRLVERLGGVPK